VLPPDAIHRIAGKSLCGRHASLFDPKRGRHRYNDRMNELGYAAERDPD
jgi:hypothetical protein